MVDQPDLETKETVLLLCTGNSRRSQMAEGFLRRMAGDRFEALSAGLEPAAEVHPLAVRVMAEKGVDISYQHPKGVMEYPGRRTAHVLVTVCGRADDRCPTTRPAALERLHWPFDDPAAFEGEQPAKLARFREVRDRIGQRIDSWLRGDNPRSGRRHEQ